MAYDASKTLYAVVKQPKDDSVESIGLNEESIIFELKDEAKRYMKFDTQDPVVIYEMRPIWRSELKKCYRKLDAKLQRGSGH